MRGYKFPLLFLSLIFVFILSLITGAAKITLPDLWAAIRAVMFGESDANQLQTIGIILNLRLPRALVTALIGAVLGLTGAALQGLFRNPLADPALVGVSAGATLFAAISILLA
jgi:iron complex transport system permease protein